MQQCLILCSGGLKSAFMASVASREGDIQLLFINHGQANFGAEHRAVIELAAYYKVPVLYEYKRPENIKTEPLLNIIAMLTIAIPIARHLRCNVIYYGLSKDDIECSSELATIQRTDSFLKSLNLLFITVQTRYDGKGGYLGQVEIEFPLFKLHGHHTIRLGNEYVTPWELTWSCEYNGKFHCGKCSKCLRRKYAFSKEGHTKDTTLYLS